MARLNFKCKKKRVINSVDVEFEGTLFHFLVIELIQPTGFITTVKVTSKSFFKKFYYKRTYNYNFFLNDLIDKTLREVSSIYFN